MIVMVIRSESRLCLDMLTGDMFLFSRSFPQTWVVRWGRHSNSMGWGHEVHLYRYSRHGGGAFAWRREAAFNK